MDKYLALLIALGVLSLLGWYGWRTYKLLEIGNPGPAPEIDWLKIINNLGPAKAPPEHFVDVFMYWRIDRAGKPTVSICDDPMSHPHAHLVRIAIPEDVRKCIDATKNPPECLVVDKKGYAVGECPKQESEIPNAP